MLTKENGIFVWRGRYEDREKPKSAGFDWNITRKRWETFDPFTAARLGEPHPELDMIPEKVARSGNAIPESANLEGLYPYQKAGVEYMAEEFRAGRRAVILADEPGLGKSAQACRLADELDWGALLVVCPASLRLNWVRELQMWRRKGPDAIAVLDGKKFPQPGKTVVISYNILIGKHWKDILSLHPFDAMILDEVHFCFPANTPVLTNCGYVDIGTLVEDSSKYEVLSQNLETGDLSYRPIVNTFKRRYVGSLVKIKAGGKEITCTANHKIFVEGVGYVRADRVEAGQIVRVVRQNSNQAEKPLLRPKVLRILEDVAASRESANRCPLEKSKRKSPDERKAAPGRSETDARKQPHERTRNQKKSFGKFESEGAQAFKTRRKRACRPCSKPSVWTDKRRGLFTRRDGIYGERIAPRSKQTDLLQDRHSPTGRTPSHRSGWAFSWSYPCAESGREKIGVLVRARVDCVEIQEQGDIGRQQNSLKDDFVYNIEVEGNNNYFAGGILVSNCKDPKAQRTKAILGKGGLHEDIKNVLMLSGTPIPNRAPEFHHILKRFEPTTFPWSYWKFVDRYTTSFKGRFGLQFTGSRNEDDLYLRLRGSGFMVRRRKADVLKDLPPKRYQMVVFPADGAMKKVLKKEEGFNANEIIENGVPVGSALPEIRKEMGLAKVGVCIEYIKGLLDGGTEKVLVGAHHIDVLGALQEGLKPYGVALVRGDVPPVKRQAEVDRFQTDPACRVFLGQLTAAGTGLTLTASSDVVFVEASWVPGDNTQFADRTHRVGQKEAVLIHYLVVEGSLDAKILGSAAKKAEGIDKIMDGNL